MPTSFAASMRFIPFGAATSLPSIVNLTVSAILVAGLFKFAAVIFQERFDRPRGGFAEGADRFAVDVVGDLEQQINILGSAVAGFDAVEHFLHPERALAAGRALAAAFVGVKLGDVERRVDD